MSICRRPAGSDAEPVSALERAGGEDDADSVDVAGGRQGDEAVPCSFDGPDGDALPDGRSQGGRVPLEVGDDLVAGHEAVGIGARVLPCREPNGPVRRDETEAVPPIAPRLADPAALQDDVVDPQARELMADRKAGGPAPHHQDVDVLHGRGVYGAPAVDGRGLAIRPLATLQRHELRSAGSVSQASRRGRMSDVLAPCTAEWREERADGLDRSTDAGD
jgi:hypothetical protein